MVFFVKESLDQQEILCAHVGKKEQTKIFNIALIVT
jgi:hypothetical protein